MLSLAKLLVLGLARLPFLRAAPTNLDIHVSEGKPKPKPPSDPQLWIYLTVAVVLVLLGGIFAGLTIALMGQDDVNLQVINESGDGKEKEHAGSVLRLLKRGKHWVLVTLLLSNVITNETLPIVLDRSLGGGWPAVLSSTALIVIFGEIIPQSICVRYGLPIGAWMSPLVLVLMYILSPIAWPTAKLLDRLLGEDHGTIYKKAGLKTLVTLHKTLGTSANERLNQDEVTIISAVLDLKDKPVGAIMTPMEDVFTLSADTILDEKMMDTVLSAGYSRIPIHSPDDPNNYVGMLLVKTLITYDPEDAKRVGDFALATLPETRPETSCLDIVNFFQEGKSHMVLVSENPGQNLGCLGVVTLEDVIEELIGEEIIDESDVYIDVHKAVRRKDQAPGMRIARLHASSNAKGDSKVKEATLIDISEDQDDAQEQNQDESKERPYFSKTDTATSTKSLDDSVKAQPKTMRSLRESNFKRGSIGDLRGQAKHLNPSNLASRPRQTRYQSVIIKDSRDPQRRSSDSANRRQSDTSTDDRSGKVVISPASTQAQQGARAPPSGYGSIMQGRSPDSPKTSSKAIQANRDSPMAQDSPAASQDLIDSSSKKVELTIQDQIESQDTVNSLPERKTSHGRRTTVKVAKSGSITENIVEAGGVRKVVLELTSSSEDAETGSNSQGDDAEASGQGSSGRSNTGEGAAKAEDDEEGSITVGDGSSSSKNKKKRRRKRRGNANGASSEQAAEDEPLLGKKD